jgi:hypothetical protein
VSKLFFGITDEGDEDEDWTKLLFARWVIIDWRLGLV